MRDAPTAKLAFRPCSASARTCHQISVLLGVPLYTNADGIIPIVAALIAKGAALGTVPAFMMSVIALSAPQIIIPARVLRPGRNV